MAIKTRTTTIDCEGRSMRAFVAWDDALAARPGIIIAPNFFGLMDFDEDKARQLAALGYVGLAFDYFAKDAPATNMEEAAAQMTALMQDRRVVPRRMLAALEALKALDEVDGRAAAMGFCLGGKCVLDLARSGAAFDGAIVYHGVFDAPPWPNAERIFPRLLVCHGWDDPMCPPDSVVALAQELTAGGSDWQMHAYGHVGHGFTNPGNPAMYDESAERRSWQETKVFLRELWG